MEKPELIKKLEAILDDAAKTRMYGNIEIEMRAGEAVLIRQARTELLSSREKTQRDYDNKK